ncbi:hypothetical protein ACFRI7_25120 [Streptomyces sp. NPDC056716]|uniref:SbtR family transcriptional regulator n=1 Tax=unclassified Streptomyces TaxID=2593676 RepID=UPI0036BADCA5
MRTWTKLPSPSARKSSTLVSAISRARPMTTRRSAVIAALVHRGEPIARAQQQLTALFADLLTRAGAAGALHSDAPPGELANYCLHALAAAGSAPDPAAVQRLVDLTCAGLGLSADGHTRSPGPHQPKGPAF